MNIEFFYLVESMCLSRMKVRRMYANFCRYSKFEEDHGFPQSAL